MIGMPQYPYSHQFEGEYESVCEIESESEYEPPVMAFRTQETAKQKSQYELFRKQERTRIDGFRDGWQEFTTRIDGI
jgi:hypothetical protein